jgi:hypothetical protein
MERSDYETFAITMNDQMLPSRTFRTWRRSHRMSAVGWILLQKSSCTRCQKFRGLQVLFSCRDLRDLIASR